MDFPDIYSATLGISLPWKITEVSYTEAENRIDISVSFSPGEPVHCPLCGAACKMSYAAEELWYHENFFERATFLHTRVPFVQCCDLTALKGPWSREGSRFSLIR